MNGPVLTLPRGPYRCRPPYAGTVSGDEPRSLLERTRFGQRLLAEGASRPELRQAARRLAEAEREKLSPEVAALIGCEGRVDAFAPEAPMTLFEKKYQQRGHTLWRFAGQFCD